MPKLLSGTPRPTAALLILIAGLSLLSWFVWSRPSYLFWDVLCYSALAGSKSADPIQLHDMAYAVAESHFADDVVKELEYGPVDGDYRRDLYLNPWHFAEQLPFYSVKPVYLLAIRGGTLLGLDILTSMRLVSVLPYFALGVVFYLLLAHTIDPVYSALGSVLTMASWPFLDAGLLPSPDALLASVAIAGLLLVFTHKKYLPGLCLLSIAPFIRTDGLVLLVIAVAYLLWKTPEFPKHLAIALVVFVVVVKAALDTFGGAYRYDVLFYHSFVHRLGGPREAHVRLTLTDYARAMKKFISDSIETERPFFGFYGVLGLMSPRRNPNSWGLCLIGVAYYAAQVALFPEHQSRHFLISFVLIAYRLLDVLLSRSDGPVRETLPEAATMA
jgi:hypothetical protein